MHVRQADLPLNGAHRPRVVLATAIYPPDGRVGALRPAKLVKYFIHRGFAVDVVTSSATGAANGLGAHGERIHVVVPRATLRDLHVRLRGGAHAGSIAFERAGNERARLGAAARASTLYGNLRSLLATPDLERGIIHPMARRVRQLLRESPAILYSTSPPHSTQVAARLAVAGSRTPWIAEFRDPWTGPDQNPPAQDDSTRRTLNRLLERSVLRRADGLVAVSDGIADWLRVRAPTTPIVTSRNGIDRITGDERRPLQPNQRINALYAGELYLGRDPTPLFAALEALIAGGRIGSHDIRCAFVGDVMAYRNTPTARLAAVHGLADVVTLSERVPRKDALALQDHSDLLILFAQDQPIQVPNKLYEYLGTRRPILAFADEGGETARLLHEVGGHFVVTGGLSSDEVAAKVEAALRSAATGVSVGAPERLHSLMTVPQLDLAAELVEEIWQSKVHRRHGPAATVIVDPAPLPTPGPDSGASHRIMVNAGWLGLQPLVLNVIGILSTAYIVRRLGIDAFGRFTFGLAVAATLGPMTDLGLRALAVRRFAQDPENGHSNLAILLALRLVLASATAAALVLAAPLISGHPATVSVVRIAAVSLLPTALMTTLIDALIAAERARSVSVANMIGGILLTLLSVIVVAGGGREVAVAAAYAAGPIVTSLILLHLATETYGGVSLRWAPREWHVLVREGRPFFRVGVLSAVTQRLDILLVGWIFGDRAVGGYGAAVSLVDRILIIPDSVSTAMLPTLAKMRRAGASFGPLFTDLMIGLQLLAWSLTLATIASAPALLTLIFGADFAAGWPVLALAILALPLAAAASPSGEALLAVHREVVMTKSGFRSQAATLMLLYPFLVAWGPIGARIAKVIGGISVIAMRWRAVDKSFPELLQDRRWPVMFRMLVVSGAAFAFTPLLWYEASLTLAWTSVVFMATLYGSWQLGLVPHVAMDIVSYLTPARFVNRSARVAPEYPRAVSTPTLASLTKSFDVAVVIPAYDAAAVIDEAVRSVGRQSIVPLGGIIVVDDGSSDETADVAARDGVQVLRQANAGPGAARNAGIRAATTEWIALLDADDRCTTDRFALQGPAIAKASPRTAVICGHHVMPGVVLPPKPSMIDFAALWQRNHVSTSTVLLRKAAWESIGGFDESRGLIGVEDYNLWLRLAHAGWEFVVLPDVLAEYRPTAASLTRQTRRFAEAELQNVRHLGTDLDLAPALVRSKTRSLLRGYGTELFHFHDREGARNLLQRAAALGPLSWPERVRLWATWMPFNWR